MKTQNRKIVAIIRGSAFLLILFLLALNIGATYTAYLASDHYMGREDILWKFTGVVFILACSVALYCSNRNMRRAMMSPLDPPSMISLIVVVIASICIAVKLAVNISDGDGLASVSLAGFIFLSVLLTIATLAVFWFAYYILTELADSKLSRDFHSWIRGMI